MTSAAFVARFERPSRAGDGWLVRCPAHRDDKASLSVGEGADGRILLRCHAGCGVDAILAAMGLSSRDLFSESTRAERREVMAYDYRDESHELLYQVVRFEPKDFRQRRPDGAGGWIWNLRDTRRVLYRLPELNGHKTVVVVEGEKDADLLWCFSVAATTNVGGAGKWRDDYTRQLVAMGVETLIIIPDNDEPGRDHAARVAAAWAPRPSRIVALPDVPEKGDVSDYLAKHSPLDLSDLLKPPQAPRQWLDVDAQLSAIASDDEEAATGRRVWLSLPALDEALGGVRRGEVCGLMARPGIGKTLFLSHITDGYAERSDGWGHVFFSLEMPAAQIVARLQQRLYGLWRQGREELARRKALDLERYRERFARFILVDTPGLSVAQMGDVLGHIAAGPLKDGGLGLVTIDHLGLIGGDRKLSTYDRVSVQAREIKELAKRFNCAVLLAVQVNRDAGGDGSRELGLGSARDSGVVEEAMDYLIGMRRLDRNLEMPAQDRERFRDVIFTKVIKNRHGDVGFAEVAYRFNPHGLTLIEDKSMSPDVNSVAHIASSRRVR